MIISSRLHYLHSSLCLRSWNWIISMHHLSMANSSSTTVWRHPQPSAVHTAMTSYRTTQFRQAANATTSDVTCDLSNIHHVTTSRVDDNLSEKPLGLLDGECDVIISEWWRKCPSFVCDIRRHKRHWDWRVMQRPPLGEKPVLSALRSRQIRCWMVKYVRRTNCWTFCRSSRLRLVNFVSFSVFVRVGLIVQAGNG